MSKVPLAAPKATIGGKAVEAEHVEVDYARGMKPKRVVMSTEFEKHAGWHQVCRKEKHKMIT